ncbi:MAG: oligosaccharide flippase family protein [Gammaproteobacteria bacterium]|nr:oligosaccharide flippase family protein [Gammaproteobacteria bacterium]
MFSKNKSAISWLLLEKILKIVVGVFVTAYVARYLGPEKWGVFAIALGTVAIFSAAAGMGADHVNLSELSKRDGKDGSVFLASAIFLRSIWSVLCLILFLLFILFTQIENSMVYYILAGTVPLAALSILGNKLQADGRFQNFAVISGTVILIGAVLKVIGVVIFMPLTFFVAIAVLEAVLASAFILCLIYLRTEFRFSKTNINLKQAKSYFRLCLPLAISAALIMLYLRLELFTVDYFLGKESAGIWAAVAMFLTPWGLVASSVIPVANKVLSTRGINSNYYEEDIIKLIRGMLAVALVAIGVNMFSVSYLVPILLGEKFSQVTELVWIASFVIIPLFMGSVQEIWIAQQRTTTTVLKKVVIGIPLSGILLTIFTIKWGLTGTAIAMVISHLLTALLLNYVFDKRFFLIQLQALGIKNG